ncbi:MAG: GyrI-like domain-containing protein [bacterium]
MQKIDYRKEQKHLYNPSKKEFAVVDVPAMNFLMIDGKGDPNIFRDFQDAVEVLFAVSYTLKFMVKKSDGGVDYAVMPLEGLWWAEDMAVFTAGNKDEWQWTLMIMQPEFIEVDLVQAGMEQVKRKKDPAALPKMRFENFHEGKAAQILYIGPYSDEGPTIEKMHRFIEQQGYSRTGKHHEIYLSDARRSVPEKLKTVLRQPVKDLANQ